MKIFSKAVLVYLGIIFITGMVSASNIYVDAEAASGGSGAIFDPFNKIQDGIDAAVNDDTVIVMDGIYTGTGNVNLDFGGKSIEVKSENGPENCIIDCQGLGGRRGFYFHNGEDENSIVKGFTIRNGKTYGETWPDDNGAAIRITGASS
ncbi:hypothetical protein GF312_17155, partial [Candidatus Poribacteria bacterium]|nr:hypothetical protein [Candidatus Poribacteria bacterium]